MLNLKQKNTAVIYIHGYGSTGAETGYEIASRLGQAYMVYAPSYCEHNPEISMKLLSEYIAGKMYSHDGDVILIGNSLGGFYANALAMIHNVKSVLINPSMCPSVNLRKYNLAQSVLDEYGRIESDITILRSKAQKTVVLGELDTVVNPANNGEQLALEAKIVRIPYMGHRMETPIHFDAVVTEINNISNNFVERV